MEKQSLAKQAVNQGLRVELIVPHNSGNLTFLHPAYGPSTYADVGLAIDKYQLKRPTMAETASLVHAYLDRRYSTEIEDAMNQRKWLWGFTGTLYVPKEGVFIQDNPEIREGIPFMDKGSLEQKLNSNDPSVRYVPFESYHKIGLLSHLEFAKHPFAIGLVGEEGAEKLARVAEEFGVKPYLGGMFYPRWLDKNQQYDENPVMRFSTISFVGCKLFGFGLGVLGDYEGGGSSGRAFGVLKNQAKIVAPKSNT